MDRTKKMVKRKRDVDLSLKEAQQEERESRDDFREVYSRLKYANAYKRLQPHLLRVQDSPIDHRDSEDTFLNRECFKARLDTAGIPKEILHASEDTGLFGDYSNRLPSRNNPTDMEDQLLDYAD